jgi:hypothetical protein
MNLLWPVGNMSPSLMRDAPTEGMVEPSARREAQKGALYDLSTTTPGPAHLAHSQRQWQANPPPPSHAEARHLSA